MINNNITIRTKTVDSAFDEWLTILTKDISQTDSRDGAVVGEVIAATTVIEDITRNMCDGKRDMSMRYALAESLWYQSADKSLSGISNFTNAWERFSDDGETVNSNYGWCVKYKYGFDQWEYVKNLLHNTPNTRQAVIHIKTADDKESKDVNCTVALQFFIRNDVLDCIVYMRSNDLWFGFPYDVFQFTTWQMRMAMELGVKFGTYTHVVGSLHLYERDYKKLELKGECDNG